MVVGEGGEPQNASASTDDFIFGQSNFCDLVFYPLYSRKFPFPYIHSYLDKSVIVIFVHSNLGANLKQIASRFYELYTISRR